MGKGTDALSGGLQGAALGAPFGPWGAGIGAAGGGLMGLFGLMPGTGGEGEDLTNAFKEVSDRYAAYRPEDMARRQEALKNAMMMMDPSRQAISAMGGGVPMTDYMSFFQPPGGGPPDPRVQTGRGTYQGAPRGGPDGGPIRGRPA